MQRPLTPEDLLAAGPLRRLGAEAQVFSELDSTNTYLLRNAGALPDGAIASAELQTAGRGRLGRAWLAPRGSSVMLSVLLHEPSESPLLSLAAMAAALAVCDAIDACAACDAVVRWPNDVAARGRKLGGVLAESVATSNGSRAVVIGAGVNCYQQAGHFAPEITNKATSLEIECDHAVDRAALAAALVRALDERITQATSPRRAELVAEWRGRCEDVGQRIRLTHDGQSHTGVIVDIADDGDLVVQLDTGGRRSFGSATTTRDW